MAAQTGHLELKILKVVEYLLGYHCSAGESIALGAKIMGLQKEVVQ